MIFVKTEYRLSIKDNITGRIISYGNLLNNLSLKKLESLNKKWFLVAYTERNLQAMIDELGMSEAGEVEPYIKEDEFEKRRKVLLSNGYTEQEAEETIEVEKQKEEDRKLAIECYEKKNKEIEERTSKLNDDEKEIFDTCFKDSNNKTYWSNPKEIISKSNDVWESLIKHTISTQTFKENCYNTFLSSTRKNFIHIYRRKIYT